MLETIARQIGRREFLVLAGAAAVAAVVPASASAREETTAMYGLIGKMTTVAGQRDALITILLDDVGAMPGCLSYVVAKDPGDPDAIWITEVWDRKESHEASLTLPAVQQAIARARPLIAGFGDSVVTEPVGGHGLRLAGG